ncbi:MAG TPA: hypothetical protein VNE58_16515 [Casimicrobiaceae bacterium]|nr:hypothetical protein [Casimicrobiaceae bacterium]
MRGVAVALLLFTISAHAQDDAKRAGTPVTLINPGFESKESGKLGAPDGWWVVQHAGPLSYTWTLDPAAPRSGERSLKVENVGPEPFGSVFQKVSAAPYRGKTLRFTAWLRTDKAAGNQFGKGAGLNLMSMRGGYPLEFVMMRDDAVAGTTDWKRYEARLKIPNEADEIEFGMSLYGPGIAWFDDASLFVEGTAAIDAPGTGRMKPLR